MTAYREAFVEVVAEAMQLLDRALRLNKLLYELRRAGCENRRVTLFLDGQLLPNDESDVRGT